MRKLKIPKGGLYFKNNILKNVKQVFFYILKSYMGKLDKLIENIKLSIKNNDPYIKGLKSPNLLIKSLIELNNVIGHKTVKKSVAQQIFYVIREKKRNIKGNLPMLNTVLYGNPGVGKTMLAEILSKIWWSLNFLKPKDNKNNIKQRQKEEKIQKKDSKREMIEEIEYNINENIISLDNLYYYFIICVLLFFLIIFVLFNSGMLNIITCIFAFLLILLILFFMFYVSKKEKNSRGKISRDLEEYLSNNNKRDDITHNQNNYKNQKNNKKNNNDERYNEEKGNGDEKENNERKNNFENKNFDETAFNDEKVFNEEDIDISEIYNCISREDMVGKYQGWSAKDTKQILLDSLGKVLFIDEAYSLVNGNNGDNFGREVIDVLNRFLSEHNGEIIVILAGYKEEMEKSIFKVQKGLKRRFMWHIDCDDYNYEELFDIFNLKLKKERISLYEEQKSEILNLFKKYEKYFVNQGGDVERLIFFCKISQEDNNDDYDYLNISEIEKGILLLLKNNKTNDDNKKGKYNKDWNDMDEEDIEKTFKNLREKKIFDELIEKTIFDKE